MPVWFVVAALSFPGLWVLSRSASSASSGSAAGVAFAVDGRGGAAALAWPDLVAFFYGDGGDGERENLGVVQVEARCRHRRLVAGQPQSWLVDGKSRHAITF